jgi:hypothetical protein
MMFKISFGIICKMWEYIHYIVTGLLAYIFYRKYKHRELEMSILKDISWEHIK